jgi:hypothetical protein
MRNPSYKSGNTSIGFRINWYFAHGLPVARPSGGYLDIIKTVSSYPFIIAQLF